MINLVGFATMYQTAAEFVGNQYLFAVLAFLIYFVVYKLVLKAIKKIIRAATSKTKSDLDDRIMDRAESPISFIIFVIGLHLIIFPLNLIAEETLGMVTVTLIIIAVAYILIATFDIIIDVWGERWAKKTKTTLDDALLPLFRILHKIIFMIGALIMVIAEWGIDVSALLAGVGIAGIALGLALQGSLSNIFGGISLILDKAIRVGDILALDNGVSGTVVDVGIRSTRIRTWDNELVIVPNGELANSNIHNKKLPSKKSRMDVNFGVEYGTDPKKVRKVVVGAMKKVKLILKDPEPYVVFKEMGGSSLDFTAYCWVNDISEKFSTRDKVVSEIYQSLNDNKIGIPFPTRTVIMEKSKPAKRKKRK